jgi:hypothetical protein
MAKEYISIKREDIEKYRRKMPLEAAEKSREMTIEKMLPFLDEIRAWTMRSAYQPTVLD